jgi:hypothetical protein
MRIGDISSNVDILSHFKGIHFNRYQSKDAFQTQLFVKKMYENDSLKFMR